MDYSHSQEKVVYIKFNETEYHNEEYLGKEMLNSFECITIEIPFKYLKGTIVEDCVDNTDFDFNTERFELEIPKKFKNILSSVLISFLKTRKKTIMRGSKFKNVDFQATMDFIDYLGLEPPKEYVYRPRNYADKSIDSFSSKSFYGSEKNKYDFDCEYCLLDKNNYNCLPELNMSFDEDDINYSIGVDEEESFERLEQLEMEEAYKEFRNMCITKDSSMEE